MALPEMNSVPAGCEAVTFGRVTYVANPKAPLRKGHRACVWGRPDPDKSARPIGVSGTYKPHPGDAERGLVRLANWCGPKRGWETTGYPCPPNLAGPAIGILITPRTKKRLRGLVEIHRFAARRLRA